EAAGRLRLEPAAQGRRRPALDPGCEDEQERRRPQAGDVLARPIARSPGAGLAGLSAAWEVNQAGVEMVVLDAGRQPGGMIVTERREGFIVEGGPDGFLAT